VTERDRELVWTVLERRKSLPAAGIRAPIRHDRRKSLPSIQHCDNKSPLEIVYLKNREIDGIIIVRRTLDMLCEWELERRG
jgi:hypothetical protein